MEQSLENKEIELSQERETPAILDEINKQFELARVTPNNYSPLNLAYIGDSVFDVIVKTVMVERGNTQVNKLHQATSKIVKAVSQAKMYDAIKESLTEEEANIMRRGRNAKPYTKAKNASYSEYCKATGIEALTGYLYLQGKTTRMIELVKLGIDKLED